MKPEDILQNGDFVVTDEGNGFYLTEAQGEKDVVIYKDGWDRLSDVVVREVYRCPSEGITNFAHSLFGFNAAHKIYPPKQQPKKMTVLEIAEELGYDIEIVKGE